MIRDFIRDHRARTRIRKAFELSWLDWTRFAWSRENRSYMRAKKAAERERRLFVEHLRSVRILPSLYDWYQEDEGGVR